MDRQFAIAMPDGFIVALWTNGKGFTFFRLFVGRNGMVPMTPSVRIHNKFCEMLDAEAPQEVEVAG